VDNDQCEVVPNNESGFVVTKISDMVSAVNILIDDAELRRKFGIAGRDYVIEQYDSHKVAKRVLDILQNRSEAKKPIRSVSGIYLNNYRHRKGLIPPLLSIIAVNPHIFKWGRIAIQGLSGHTRYSRFLNSMS